MHGYVTVYCFAYSGGDLAFQLYTDSCDNGELGFFGGSESEGLLIVCMDQKWGTINGDGWSFIDTKVACRDLGFKGSGCTLSDLSYQFHAL